VRSFRLATQNEGSVELNRPAADKEKAAEVPSSWQSFSSSIVGLLVFSAISVLKIFGSVRKMTGKRVS
jgi:hypothetical protein